MTVRRLRKRHPGEYHDGESGLRYNYFREPADWALCGVLHWIEVGVV